MSLNNKLPFEIVHIELANSYEDAQKIAQRYNAELPTMEQLGQLATYLYNYDEIIGDQQDISSGINLDITKASQFISASPFSNRFYVWSGQEYSRNYAYYRYFGPTYTYWYTYVRYYSGNLNGLAVCLGEVPVKNIREELDSDIKKWMEELSKRYEYNSITT
ncbi:hypothetical protein [uncultured Megamonas sp.]|uniref:hypothetical protein n=1 Tax=uncultured Megamonas sp. TaxID=286140 RepID=UPI00259B0F41|nr:hypothetical protein [uncultured Megamonas sp.]